MLGEVHRLNGVGGELHAPASLPPGKSLYPLHRRLSGLEGRSVPILTCALFVCLLVRSYVAYILRTVITLLNARCYTYTILVVTTAVDKASCNRPSCMYTHVCYAACESQRVAGGGMVL